MTPTVLLADDSTVIRAVLREQLVSHGLHILEAVNGEEAVHLAQRHLPDIILLDIDMPVMNGHEALVQMQAEDDTRDIPVVFLTGRVQVADAVEGLSLGAYDYLRKPVDPIELIARVSAALRVKQLRDELRARNEELSVMSRTDALTGLYNRRHMEELMARVTQSGGPLAVVMADIDFFKVVNDTWGHAVGDQVLRVVALTLRSQVHGDEALGRWGGEEFLTLLPIGKMERATVVAEHMRSAVEAAPIKVPDGSTISVTISVGCAAGASDVDEVVRLADTALYAAKDSGRNVVRTAT